MQLESNKIIIASAGSGKTTLLVKEALSRSDKRIAVLTYTNNNIKEIKKKFYEKHDRIPKGVDVMTWFSFLLRECTRPYQRSMYSDHRVKSICFSDGHSARYARHSNIGHFYFRNGDEIYSDKISRFVIDCITNSNGLVTKRLADIYDEIFIDEFQDLAGYDLNLLELFLKSEIRIVVVGDPRQCTYTTNSSAKNSQYRGIGIMKLIGEWKNKELCQIEKDAKSYRCNEEICKFADKLWPDIEPTVSYNSTGTEHDGIFVVSENNVHQYINHYRPAVLRYDRNANTYGYPAQNFGNAKGLEFDRVLVIPHGPIKKYLEKGDVEDVKKSLEKFYVAVTRAKHSVAFLYDGKCSIDCIEWNPTADS